ncbi:adenine phosphoribosyltransferase [Lethenteron reissneri]|uniref:adenine phosphoribosyltransferase n=1 Tax=Lethenteron reissneri TaxID=7753 RepID=UPI002AB767A6|nr:adenine phosphoribosyltransferase [Lethenteron reissneri]
MPAAKSSAEKTALVARRVGVVPDFPKPGILFRDVCPLLKDPEAFNATIELLEEKLQKHVGSVDLIAGLEARGFLFGPSLAARLGVGFIPLRKKGKLPGETVAVSYTLEYGQDVVEAQVGALKPGQNVVIVDDLIATGGTMAAASQLIQKLGGTVLQCLVVIELVELRGRELLEADMLQSLLQY